MRAVIQRVKYARINCSSGKESSIGRGYVIMLGIDRDDCLSDLDYMLKKIPHLRLFPDADSVKNLSILEMNSAEAGRYATDNPGISGEILLVSNFTLLADTRRGRRPHYGRAAEPEVSQPLYDQLVSKLRLAGVRVATGVFGDMMQTEMLNDGPVTIILDSKNPDY
jgi:D-aminoacyl-tRNA deacylase